MIKFLDPDGDGHVDLGELTEAFKLVMSAEDAADEEAAGAEPRAAAPPADEKLPPPSEAEDFADEAATLSEEEAAVALRFLDPDGDGIALDELDAALRSARFSSARRFT